MTEEIKIKHPLLQSISQWGPIILVLLLSGITYGVQRTSLSLIPGDLTYLQVNGTDLKLQDMLIFIQISTTLAAFGIFKGFSGYISNTISQRYQRKITIRIGLGLLFFGSIGMVFTKQLWVLPLGNALIGAGLGLIFTISMTTLSELAGTTRGAFSIGSMEFSVYLGSSIGSFLAGVIANNFGFGSSFVFALLMATSAIVVGSVFIKNIETEDNIKGKKEEVLLDSSKVEHEWTLSNIFKTPTLLTSYIGAHLSRIKDSLLVLIFPVLLYTVYNFRAVEVGTATSVFTLAWSLSMPLTGRISDKTGRKIPIFIGLILEGLGIILISFTSSFGLIVIFAFIAGVGTSFYYPVFPSIAKDVAPIIKREQVIGIYRAALDSGYFTGPILILLLMFIGGRWEPILTVFPEGAILKLPFLVIGILLIFLAFLFLFLAIETRPGWVQTSYTLSHANKVKTAFYEIRASVIAYLDNDLETFAIKRQTAKEREREADELVLTISNVMYSSARAAPDDYQFYKIADTLDSSIGYLLRSVRKLQLIPLANLPEMYKKYLIDELDLLVEMMEKTYEALEVTIIQPMTSHPIFQIIHHYEHKLDNLAQNTLENFIPLSQECDSAIEVLFLTEIISYLEKAANILEDVADIMKILGMKHSIK